MSPAVAIIGLGGMGAAAAASLAGRGVRVVGFDRHRPPHDRGSSHGGSRVARTAYFEHPDYVPLLKSAFEGWDRYERDTGRRCLHRSGVLLLGGPDSAVLDASKSSADAHGLEVEHCDAGEIRRRWGIFRLPGDVEGLLEPNAGFVVPEHGVAAGLELAARDGAEFRFDTPVLDIEASGERVAIRTPDERAEVDRVVVAAGAWTARLLPQLASSHPLSPQRKAMVWLRPRPGFVEACREDRMPAWLYDDGGDFDGGVYYGVPTWSGQVGPAGAKIGFHGPGLVVDPEDHDRGIPIETRDRFGRDLESFMPGVFEPPHAAASCLYTMSSDEHFLIDRLPESPSVVVAAGFSGHGYKFAPVVGEILADLAIEGTTSHPAGFLGLAGRARS